MAALQKINEHKAALLDRLMKHHFRREGAGGYIFQYLEETPMHRVDAELAIMLEVYYKDEM